MVRGTTEGRVRKNDMIRYIMEGKVSARGILSTKRKAWEKLLFLRFFLFFHQEIVTSVKYAFCLGGEIFVFPVCRQWIIFCRHCKSIFNRSEEYERSSEVLNKPTVLIEKRHAPTRSLFHISPLRSLFFSQIWSQQTKKKKRQVSCVWVPNRLHQDAMTLFQSYLVSIFSVVWLFGSCGESMVSFHRQWNTCW